MNYMSKIAEMLGVKMGERFDIKSGETIIPECHIDTLGLRDDDLWGMPKLFLKLLNGNAEIIKKPFRPDEDEAYWYIDFDGYVKHGFCINCTFDYMAMYIGNCFRTEAEAKAHKDEIVAKFRELIDDDRE